MAIRSGKAEASRAPTEVDAAPSSGRLRRPPSPEGEGIALLSPKSCRERRARPSPSGEGGRRPDEGGVRPPSQSSREAPGIIGPLRAVAPEGSEPGSKIDGIATKSTFSKHDSDFARHPRVALAGGVDHHASETRRQRKARNRAAFLGNAPVAVDGADRRQERARLLYRGARGRIEKASFDGSATPQRAQSSARPERSAERISGAA